jgi:hypothetical protein
MKTLLVLTAAAMMTAAATGCSLFNRGQPCNQCGPGGGDAYMGAPAAISSAPIVTGPSYGAPVYPGPVQ